MTKYYDTKIGKIIDKIFDARMTNAVIGYIIDKGWDNVKEITDEEIASIEGQALMTVEFAQVLVRTAREICRTCSVWEDFMPYIRCHIGINGYQTEEFSLYTEDFNENQWENIMDEFKCDYETECVKGFVIVTDEIIYEKEENM